VLVVSTKYLLRVLRGEILVRVRLRLVPPFLALPCALSLTPGALNCILTYTFL
jgi:hypothetical protein